MWVNSPHSRYTTKFGSGRVTEVTSQQSVRINGTPRHVKDLRPFRLSHPSDDVGDTEAGGQPIYLDLGSASDPSDIGGSPTNPDMSSESSPEEEEQEEEEEEEEEIQTTTHSRKKLHWLKRNTRLTLPNHPNRDQLENVSDLLLRYVDILGTENGEKYTFVMPVRIPTNGQSCNQRQYLIDCPSSGS